MIECACKDCVDRNVGCHSVCEKYAEFKRQKQEVYEQKANASNYGNVYFSYKKRVMDDAIRKARNRRR